MARERFIRTRSLIIGALLGDAHIRDTGLMYIGHSVHQKEYVLFKMAMFKKYKPKYFERDVYLDGKKFVQVGFYTKVSNLFKTARNVMYPNGVKTVRRKDLNKLTPEGIAIWYCDDGGLSAQKSRDGRITSYCSYLNTQSFGLDGTQTVVDYFAEVYGLSATINKNKGSYRVRFNWAETVKLMYLIGKHIPDCMGYKNLEVMRENITRVYS